MRMEENARNVKGKKEEISFFIRIEVFVLKFERAKTGFQVDENGGEKRGV